MSEKPMQGFITKWCLTNEVIYGQLTYADGTVGDYIRTSRVVSITLIDGMRVAETQNSRYILI